MAKQCVVNRDSEGKVESVVVKNYSNLSPMELSIKRNNNFELDKAPNGKDSILYQNYINDLGLSPEEAKEKIAQLYTDQFGNFFGKWWESDVENISKVVDENGQPMIVYHGTNKDFEVFNGTEIGNKELSFFTPNIEYAKGYAYSFMDYKRIEKRMSKEELDKIKILPVFLNIRNLKEKEGINTLSIIKDIKEDNKYDGYSGTESITNEKSFVTTQRNQIKSLLNNGEFDTNNENIYFNKENNKNKSQTPRELIKGLTDKLLQKNLVSKVSLFTNEQIVEKLKELGISDKIAKKIEVWHGSPHFFDRFTTDKMGTGEGVQAFGWGLYFTDLKGIAENYADSLSDYKVVIPSEYKELFNRNLKGIDIAMGMVRVYDGVLFITNAISNAIIDLSISIDQMEAKNLQNIEAYQVRKNDLEELKKIDLNTISSKFIEKSRNLYNVSLHEGKTPEQYTWLEWDKPLNQKKIENIYNLIENKIPSWAKQRGGDSLFKPKKGVNVKNLTFLEQNTIEKIKKKKEDYVNFDDIIYNLQVSSEINIDNDKMDLFSNDSVSYQDAIRDVENNRDFIEKYIQSNVGQKIYEYAVNVLGGPKQASLFLLENGIDGVKYPAESISRGATSDNARGFNYVVFDENAITINEVIQFNKELSEAGLKSIIGGFFNSATKEIYLNEDSNDLLNSTLHEFSHPVLQWLRDNRREHFDAGIQVLKNNSTEAQPYIDKVKELYPNLKEGSDAFVEEVLATIVGDRGAQLVRTKENSNIQTWLNDLWEMFKDIVGLTNYSTEEVSNMSLQEFSDAVNAEMFNSEAVRSYSLGALESKEFKSNQGRNVSKQHLENLIKRQNVKQAERDIMNNVLDNMDTTGKINYNEFESAVKASIMPLTIIESSSYASYGSESIDGEYDSTETMIFNSPIEHGVVGHFEDTYIESEIRTPTILHIDDVRFTDEDTGEKITSIPGEPYIKSEDISDEEVQKKLDKINNERLALYNELINNPEKKPNKGLFGHTRVWSKGNIYNVAEVQSDVFQDKNYKLYDFMDPMYDDEVITKFNNEKTGSEVEDVKIVNKIINAFEKKSVLNQFRALEKFFELRLIRESLKDAANKGFEKLRLPLPYTISKIEGYIGEEGQVQIEGEPNIGDIVDYLDEDHMIMDYEDGIVYLVNKNNLRNINEDDGYNEVAEDIFDKVFENIINDGETYSINELKGKMIYGSDAKYMNIIDDYLTTLRTEEDEQINIEDIKYDIIQEISDNISPQDLTNYFKDEFEWKNAIVKNDLLYYTNANSEAISYIDNRISKEEFTISDLSEKHQPIAKRYEAFGKMLQKERGKDNYRIVEDENGYPWYETDIKESDKLNPVLAFNKENYPYSSESNNINFQIEVKQKDFIPSQLFEELSEQPFMTKDQALSVYKSIYTEELNHWKDSDLNC